VANKFVYRVEVAGLLSAIVFSMANLKAASVDRPRPGKSHPESQKKHADSSMITFPPSSAQKWVLSDGLTLIVQEDRSAPVASVQAWCGTGSIYEDEKLGAGL